MYFGDSTAGAARTVFLPTRDGQGRFAFLDVVRGLLLVLMAINHVPSDLHGVTDHPLGYMSAAEGFVFLAGLMGGLVYTRLLLRSGPTAVLRASLRRAGTIYGFHLGAFLFVLAWVTACRCLAGFTPSAVPEQILNHPALALMAGSLLLYQPSLFDILPMYCGFILLLPFLLRALERGHRGRLLALSVTVWALANILLPQDPFIAGAVHTGAFNLLSWQLLFVTGVVFGHAWTRGLKLLPTPNRFVVALTMLGAAWLFLVRHALISSGLPGPVLGWLINKNNLAPLRLLDVGLILWLVHLLVGRFPAWFSGWKPLEFLGRHSISVFTFHVVLAYLIHAFPDEFARDAGGRFLSTALMLAGLFAAAAGHHLFQRKPTLVCDETIPAWLPPQNEWAFAPLPGNKPLDPAAIS